MSVTRDFFIDRGRGVSAADFPLLDPVDSVLPPPGPSFLATANDLSIGEGDGMSCLRELYRAALYQPDFSLRVTGTKAVPTFRTRFVPGHRWGAHAGEYGPTRCPVMVVGKHPGVEEMRAGRNFVGSTSVVLVDAIHALGVSADETAWWYMTNLLRFPPPRGFSGALPAIWIKDCLPLLHEEVRLVRPKYILLLGTEAAKAVMGKSVKVTDQNVAGRAMRVTFPLADGTEHEAMAVCCVHPAAVHRDERLFSSLTASLEVFLKAVRGVETPRTLESDQTRYRYLFTAKELDDVVDEVLSETTEQADLAWDCEWHGRHFDGPGSYLLSVQFSHRPYYGAAVVLHRPGGELNPDLSRDKVLEALMRLSSVAGGRKVRTIGHNLKADIPWLLHHVGFDLRSSFRAPVDDPWPWADDNLTPAGWQKTRYEGGFDTLLAAHAINERKDLWGFYKLEVLGHRLLGLPRYDIPLQEELAAWCLANDVPKDDIDGYGMLSEERRLPYSVADVDVTHRLVGLFNGVGDEPGWLDVGPEFGELSRQAFWVSMRGALTDLEIESTGLLFDFEQFHHLRQVFREGRDRKLAELRAAANWPDLTPSKPSHRLEWLFGEKYNGKDVRVRPAEAKTLGLYPLLATGDDKKSWDEALGSGIAESALTPCADKEVLGNLRPQAPDIQILLDHNVLGHALTTVLAVPPDPTEPKPKSRRKPAPRRRKNLRGLTAFVGPTGRVRTSMFPIETGRRSSSDPNLQNLAGDQLEEKFAEILGPGVPFQIRSVFVSPPGSLLVGADYNTAEVELAAWLSGDENLVALLARSKLTADDPEYLDIHSYIAVRTFKLGCPPTKKALKALGKLGLRTAAKRTLFGWFYGIGAETAARKANEDGAGVTVAEVQALLDELERMFPRLTAYFRSCRERVQTHGYLVNSFGRPRRFGQTDDRQRQAANGREAMNNNMQAGVADMLQLSLGNLDDYRRENSHISYKILIQTHDAVTLEVPVPHVVEVVRTVLPRCMTDLVPFVPTDFDGIPTGRPAQFLGITTSVYRRWGIPLTPDELEAEGLPRDLND